MRFAWSLTKNRLNKQKHNMCFELAQKVFDGPYALTWEDKRFEDYDEERWITLGCIENEIIAVVVHTYRGEEDEQETIRIISARKATKKEHKIYYGYQKYSEKSS